jgi:hypothetical protein
MEAVLHCRMSPTRRVVDCNHIVAAVGGLVIMVLLSAAHHQVPIQRPRQVYHISSLTEVGWVQDLMLGHPNRIKTELGMRLHIFKRLISDLSDLGLAPLWHISLEEQVAIFLYMSVTGLSIRHIGEHFQHSNETISLYFFLFFFILNCADIIEDISTEFVSLYLHHHSIIAMSDDTPQAPYPHVDRSRPKLSDIYW